jgi:hypothetical protein
MSGEFRSFSFFAKPTITATGFAAHEFKFVDSRAKDQTPTQAIGAFVAGSIKVINDGPGTVEISFGKDPTGAFVVHGELAATEEITWINRYETRIFLRRAGVDNAVVRIYAW